MMLIQNDTIGDLDNPTIPMLQSSIVLSDVAQYYKLKNIHSNMMSSSYGLSIEDPKAHIRDIFNVALDDDLSLYCERQSKDIVKILVVWIPNYLE